MASSARIDEIKKKFDENPRRYFAPLANEFRKAGDLEQAILICEEYLPQQAGHMSGHIVYGQALYEAGRLPESRTVFETALGLDPENLIALRHLGDIARANGDPAEARRWYDRVLEADPRNDEIQGLLQSLDADGSASPTAPEGASANAHATSAPPSEHGAPPPLPAHPLAARPELSPIDLDMDAEGFAPPPLPAQPAARLEQDVSNAPDSPTVSAFPHALGLQGFEPTNAGAAGPVGTPAAPGARAEGLEPAEFEVPSAPTPRAPGLEPAEFEAPAASVARTPGLETSEFEAPPSSSADHGALPDLEGSFAAETHSGGRGHVGSDAPLAGREETGAAHPPEDADVVLPMLDLDEGFTVAPHGDPVAHASRGAATAASESGDGHGDASARMEPPAAMEAMPALERGVAASAAPPVHAPEAAGRDTGDAMLELPPQVIAAESALMDVADEYGFGDVSPSASAPNSARAPFVTETMAELYLKQGFAAQALDVYRQLALAAPDDVRLRDKVALLERGASSEAPIAGGPTVRDFLFQLATRRPNQRAEQEAAPSPSDFASFEAIPEPVHEAESATFEADVAEDRAIAPPVVAEHDQHSSSVAPAASEGAEPPLRPTPAMDLPAVPMPSRAERGVTAQGGAPAGGTIDALFGGRAASTSEDSAASALAQAFGGTTEAPTISGRAAHAASGELSLDSVFRDGPSRAPRVSQGFAFDQFFSESASDTAAPGAATPETPAAGEPAERGADDVKQFNSWLQGLRPR